jgi:phosphoribosylformylglycinamidine synthase
MIGLIEDVRRVVQAGFKREGDVIALLGETNDDLTISEYAAIVQEQSSEAMIATGRVPAIDLDRELAVQATC